MYISLRVSDSQHGRRVNGESIPRDRTYVVDDQNPRDKATHAGCC